jgi:hypothetical protein
MNDPIASLPAAGCGRKGDQVRKFSHYFSFGVSMSKSHAMLKFLRKVHLYVGIFTTPALFFFAITGAMQTFSLHEMTQGSDYKPPAWIATLAQLHKKQTTVVPVRKARPADKTTFAGSNGAEHKADGFSRPEPAGAAAPQKRHLPMKIFFLLVSVSLLLSTLTGIYMAYKYSRGWLVLTGLLMAGIVVPLLLLPF